MKLPLAALVTFSGTHREFTKFGDFYLCTGSLFNAEFLGLVNQKYNHLNWLTQGCKGGQGWVKSKLMCCSFCSVARYYEIHPGYL